MCYNIISPFDNTEILMVVLVRDPHPIRLPFTFAFILNIIYREQKCWFDARRYRYFTVILAFIFAGYVAPIFVLPGRGCETRTNDVIKGEPCNEGNRGLCRIRTEVIPLTGNSVEALCAISLRFIPIENVYSVLSLSFSLRNGFS